MLDDSVSAEQFRAAMASFAAGVTIVTTIAPNGSVQGLTATAFSAVSLEPPLCLVCVNQHTRAHELLLRNGCFAVSILSVAQEALSWRFAAPIADRFSGVDWVPGERTRCPLISGALASVECHVAAVHSAGDHDIFLGRVASAHVNDGAPLVYWRGGHAAVSLHEQRRMARDG